MQSPLLLTAVRICQMPLYSAQHLGFGTRHSLVHSREAGRLIVTIGVEDLVVVDTGDILLVCSKERAQDVRNVIRHLKENDLTQYL